MKKEIQDKLVELYGEGEMFPSYVKDAGKDFIVIVVTDSNGNKDLKITIEDMVRYIKEESDSKSGARTIAGHLGDWRRIEELANEVFDYFRLVNKEELKEEGIRQGLVDG